MLKKTGRFLRPKEIIEDLLFNHTKLDDNIVTHFDNRKNINKVETFVIFDMFPIQANILYLLMATLITAEGDEDEFREYLVKTNYSKVKMPRLQTGRRLDVQTNIYLLSLGNVDHVALTYDLTCWVTLTWTDKRL